MPAKKTIVYSCDPTCKPDVKNKTLKVKKYVYLVADATDVTLQFTNSPFNPPDTTISIAADTVVKKKIGSTTGTFHYSLTCSNCRTPQDDPSMIIEL
jgi:hypothetical protein